MQSDINKLRVFLDTEEFLDSLEKLEAVNVVESLESKTCPEEEAAILTYIRGYNHRSTAFYYLYLTHTPGYCDCISTKEFDGCVRRCMRYIHYKYTLYAAFVVLVRVCDRSDIPRELMGKVKELLFFKYSY